MRKWFEMRAGAPAGAAEISIYGSIGKSWWDDDAIGAADFARDLKALGDVSEITLRVNSPGGDVFDGVTIHNLLAQHPAKVIARIDGLAASAASFIVMAADEIVMPSNTFMLIHEPSGGAWGTSETLMAMAADLERMTATFAETYAQRTGMSAADVKALMKDDRLVDAAEAKEKGLCDRLDAEVKMAASYSLDRLPASARERLASIMSAPAEDVASVGQEPQQPQQPGDDEDNVVDIATMRSKAEQKGYAAAQEIVDLCALAGLPQMASGFITERKSVVDVRAALVSAKAVQSERDAISGAHAARVTPAPSAAWAKIIEKQNSRVR